MRQVRGLMGLTPPKMGYEGVVRVGMQQVQVVDGVMDMGGRKLSVAEDGIVADEQGKPVAKVVNGQLAPMQAGGVQ